MKKDGKEKKRIPSISFPPRGGCLWPIGDPIRHADFHFCSARKKYPLPYCEAHCAIAYIPKKKKGESNAPDSETEKKIQAYQPKACAVWNAFN